MELSVLMPVYNNASYLQEAVDSILSQTFQDFEFIIVDDGSTDGSSEILKDYSKKDKRIKLLRNNLNRGIVYSLNKGLSECTGKFIARMDSDDISLPFRFSKQLEIMRSDENIILLSAATTHIDEKGKEMGIIMGDKPLKSILYANPIRHPTVVMRRDILLKHCKVYKETYKYAEDYYLWLEMSKLGKIYIMSDVVLQYRTSSTATHSLHLRQMLISSIQLKIMAMLYLSIRPTAMDLVKLFFECLACLLPRKNLFWLYKKIVLRKNKMSTPLNESGKSSLSFIDGTQSKYASSWANNPKLLSRLPNFLSTRVLTMMSVIWSISMLLCSYLAGGKDQVVYIVISVFIMCHYITDGLDGAVGRFRKEGYVRWGFFVDHVLDIAFLGCVSISLFMHQQGTLMSILSYTSLFSCQMLFIAHFLSDIVYLSNTSDVKNVPTSYSPALFGIPMYFWETAVSFLFAIFALFDIPRFYVCCGFCVNYALMLLVYIYQKQSLFATLDQETK